MFAWITPMTALAGLLLLVGCSRQNTASPDAVGAPAQPAPSVDPYRAGVVEEAAAGRSPFTGQMAPDFTLVNQSDQPVALSTQRGRWVVLYFYPKDDTPGCTCQATEFTSLLKNFRDMNAEILGVSEDTPASHRAFAAKYYLALTLLSDPDHRVMESYGAWVTSGTGANRYGRLIRTTFIIDPSGVIRYHWPEVIPEGHAERVRQKLAQLQGQ